jgi:hypothetical protein
MLVSALHDRSSDKRAKDLEQAAVLVAILAERDPSALEEGFRDIPVSARKKTRTAAKAVLSRLEESAHESAAAVLRELLG